MGITTIIAIIPVHISGMEGMSILKIPSLRACSRNRVGDNFFIFALKMRILHGDSERDSTKEEFGRDSG